MNADTKNQTPPTWKEAHRELTRIAKARGDLDHQEWPWLLVAFREAAHVQLGFGSFAEYVESTCGYTPRQTAERLRVARALEDLPVTRQALDDGRISWSVAREITRVATSDTEEKWVEAVRHKNVRQVERLVAGLAVGDLPGDPSKKDVKRHTLRIEVSAETLATYRDAIARLQRQAGGGLDEDAALLTMARQVLGGPKDDARASYQIAMTVCPECGRGQQEGRGKSIQVGAEIVEMAECDAQMLPEHTHVGANQRATQTIPPATRRAVIRRDGGKCVVPGCRHATFLDIHHLKLRSEGGDHDPDLLVTTCGGHHRAAHRGTLIIEGSVKGGLCFRHADGTVYGGPVSPEAAEAHADAFLALKSFGFKESESRAALRRVQTAGEANVSTLVRDALRALRPMGVSERRVSYSVGAPTWVHRRSSKRWAV